MQTTVQVYVPITYVPLLMFGKLEIINPLKQDSPMTTQSCSHWQLIIQPWVTLSLC